MMTRTHEHEYRRSGTCIYCGNEPKGEVAKVARGEEYLRRAALDLPYQRIAEWAQARFDDQTPPDAESVTFQREARPDANA